MSNCYRMDGTPYNDVMDWARDHERMLRDRTAFIGDTHIWPYRISTVWLGLDHNHSPNGPPLIFETMVFRRATWRTWLKWWKVRHSSSSLVRSLGQLWRVPGAWDWSDLAQERYSTREAAIAGHDQMVERWRPWWSRLVRRLRK